MDMSNWRKKLLIILAVALLVGTIAFWGTIVGGCCILVLIIGFQFYMFNSYASSDLAKTFEESGLNIRGWKD